MSQGLATDLNINPNTTTGTQLATILNRFHDAILTAHSGAARPAYSKAGTIWYDDSPGSEALYYFDGTNDIPIAVGYAVLKGGTPGQVLAKASATDGDLVWSSGGGGLSWKVSITGITAVDGTGYMMDTTAGALPATLPTGAPGMKIGFKDYAQTFDTNNLTITPAAGELIEGQATPLIIDNQGWSGVLEYIDAAKGWMLVESSPMGAWGTGSLVPTGGAADQVLSKIDGIDGNVQWATLPSGIPAGGAADQVLSKVDSTDGNVQWGNVVVPDPAAGTSQSITSGAPADTPLELTPAAAQTAALLKVNGHDLFDKDGYLLGRADGTTPTAGQVGEIIKGNAITKTTAPFPITENWVLPKGLFIVFARRDFVQKRGFGALGTLIIDGTSSGGVAGVQQQIIPRDETPIDPDFTVIHALSCAFSSDGVTPVQIRTSIASWNATNTVPTKNTTTKSDKIEVYAVRIG